MLAQINGITSPAGLRFANENTLVGDVVTWVLRFAIVGAGLYFLFRLLSTGFSVLSSAGEPAKLQAAAREASHALIGLTIVITAFFLAQILESILGLQIL